ncbi:unnamed protein product [Gadus morhua 'NCC']
MYTPVLHPTSADNKKHLFIHFLDTHAGKQAGTAQFQLSLFSQSIFSKQAQTLRETTSVYVSLSPMSHDTVEYMKDDSQLLVLVARDREGLGDRVVISVDLRRPDAKPCHRFTATVRRSLAWELRRRLLVELLLSNALGVLRQPPARRGRHGPRVDRGVVVRPQSVLSPATERCRERGGGRCHGDRIRQMWAEMSSADGGVSPAFYRGGGAGCRPRLLGRRPPHDPRSWSIHPRRLHHLPKLLRHPLPPPWMQPSSSDVAVDYCVTTGRRRR